MKTMKRNRLRQLVQWGYITQPQANQMWRDYLRLFKRVNQKGQKMHYAQIKINVYVDESKLSPEQQDIANKCDTDLRLDYPADKGCDTIRNNPGNLLTHFAYLGSGIAAIKIDID